MIHRSTLARVALVTGLVFLVCMGITSHAVGAPAPQVLAAKGLGPQEHDAILTALDKVDTAPTQAVGGYTPQFGPAEHDQIRSALEMANDAAAGAPSGLSSSRQG